MHWKAHVVHWLSEQLGEEYARAGAHDWSIGKVVGERVNASSSELDGLVGEQKRGAGEEGVRKTLCHKYTRWNVQYTRLYILRHALRLNEN